MSRALGNVVKTSHFVGRFGHELRRFARREGGNALVEFALVVPILTLLAVGTFDFGLAFQQKHRIGSAAQAGAQIAVQERSAEEVSVAAIATRVHEEAGDSVPYELTVTPRYYCTCFGETAEQDCTANPNDVCPAGNTRPLLKYVEVDVQHDADLIFDYPGVAQSIPLRATSTMRVK